MEHKFVNINCDMGEGIGDDAGLMPFISSCSIACGGHAGNTNSMRKTVVLAKGYNVKVGAHPSYPDRENFGRISMAIPDNDLIETIQEQIESLVSVLKREKMELHHIKPHGALYNDIAKDGHLASVFLKALNKYGSRTCLYVPYASLIAEKALRRGFRIRYEAFGDRRYQKDLSLVSRSKEGALILDPKKVLEQVMGITNNNEVRVIEGKTKKILADTLCIHGDTPSALQIVSYLNKELPKHSIQIRK